MMNLKMKRLLHVILGAAIAFLPGVGRADPVGTADPPQTSIASITIGPPANPGGKITVWVQMPPGSIAPVSTNLPSNIQTDPANSSAGVTAGPFNQPNSPTPAAAVASLLNTAFGAPPGIASVDPTNPNKVNISYTNANGTFDAQRATITTNTAMVQFATVNADGTFTVDAPLPGFQGGLATAQTQDPYGVPSNQTSYLIATPPPAVAAVVVGSDQWSASFVSYLQSAGLGNGGYAIPVGSTSQLNTLPWNNLDQISITSPRMSRFCRPICR